MKCHNNSHDNQDGNSFGREVVHFSFVDKILNLVKSFQYLTLFTDLLYYLCHVSQFVPQFLHLSKKKCFRAIWQKVFHEQLNLARPLDLTEINLNLKEFLVLQGEKVGPPTNSTPQNTNKNFPELQGTTGFMKALHPGFLNLYLQLILAFRFAPGYRLMGDSIDSL